ncbi:integrin alpha-PS3-like isoform X2 [Hyposmocoma kahamanoa]|uniref:integrin alpha-PS3-like isoform X2 n=1 Tax=Hyposmocoma kahamanoa TaxID=1477025 RepID=UPI000E6D96EA|nr:integrin alpha-PS3-like isoform X2 [Hyposmocoma kahamanoa]
MHKTLFILIFVTFNLKCSEASDIFHINSNITFYPDSVSDYFGYAVVLSDAGLIVGAPKAKSRISNTTAPGAVFTCELTDLAASNVTCYSMGIERGRAGSKRRIITVEDFFQNDMWFGATIAVVPKDKLLVCAPRWTYPFQDKKYLHYLGYGACYIEGKSVGKTLTPLTDRSRLALRTDGVRKEYGEYQQHLNYFAYGQAGMSVKVTQDNSIIIGAPGLLQWTGGIIEYRFITDPRSIFFDQVPVANPYYTLDLGPDDYFGYSVESGVFQLNGSTLYVAAAPRSKKGYGQVLVFDPPTIETAPLNVRARVQGSQLGSYFGASLCCLDINNDGRSDLLVGAPNFVKKDGDLPYDQGAVFVYLAEEKDKKLVLKDTGYVSGSGVSGSRFGNTIAVLGDIDGDGFKDVAIGAPWENEGKGAVYIYKGSAKGLKQQYVQKIEAEGARGFGISVSKGFDVDHNNCNDLAIGAHISSTVYFYRCIPTIQVHTDIRVPDAMNLPQNTTKFSAIFCVTAPVAPLWPGVHFFLDAAVTIDQEDKRASIAGDPNYSVTVSPGTDSCNEHQVEVKPTADLSKPISMKFEVKPARPFIDVTKVFMPGAARLSEDSTLQSSFLIQLVRDCGDDLICTPWLVMTMEAFEGVYVPGTNNRLGVKITVTNQKEPAYGAKVDIKLPLPPKRVGSLCNLKDLLMTCDVPAPLGRGESIDWNIELEDLKETEKKVLKLEAELKDSLYRTNVSDGKIVETFINIVPKANFSLAGKALPNISISVTREKFYSNKNLTFAHYYEISSSGPSDWKRLNFSIELSENVSLTNIVKDCKQEKNILNCTWFMPAYVTRALLLALKLDLDKHGRLLEELGKFNATTILKSTRDRQTVSVTTVLILDPATPIWPIIVGIIAGVLFLAVIVYALYKRDFFSRTKRNELKRLQEEKPPEEASTSSRQLRLEISEECAVHESTDRLLIDTDDSSRELILAELDSD